MRQIVQESRVVVGEPRHAAVNFDTYQILQRLRIRTCGFLATARLSCWSLSAECIISLKVTSTRKKSDRRAYLTQTCRPTSHDRSQLLPP